MGACSVCVGNPEGGIVVRADELAWEVRLGSEDMREHGGFGGAEDVEDGMGGIIDGVEGEGHAPGLFLGDVVGDDEAALDMEAGGVRKEGGGVAIFSHAEHDEVEGLALEDGDEFFFVFFGVVFYLIFGNHPVDVVGCEEHFVEAGFHGHAVITFGVGGRDGPLVAPEEMDFVPLDLFFVRGVTDEFVEGFRC